MSRPRSPNAAPDAEPLLPRNPSPSPDVTTTSNVWPVTCLCLQHLSSTFNDACYNFAVFLFLIDVFNDTLVPASLVGLFTTLSGLMLARYIGRAVDAMSRLRLFMQAATYCSFLVLFNLGDLAQSAFHLKEPLHVVAIVWGILILIIVCSCGVGLANTALNLAVERDWVMTIATGDNALLTSLNTYLRRIDLLSKLCAPLTVSLCRSYANTIFLVATILTATAEVIWIGVVYSHFPTLAHKTPVESETTNWLRDELRNWRDFIHLPIFWSSAAIATIYFTTLSYDGTFIAYVKAARGYDDTFVAIMRAISVLTGLFGTLIMPRLEDYLGLERAGAWSIWFEAACLAPVVFAFFNAGKYGTHGSLSNNIMLFGGIALSRVGLWSFDLCQIKELQLALEHHPNPSQIAAFQVALQNAFHLATYAMTLAASTPQHFKWTALISWIAVITGASMYTVFLRTVRGHLIHLEWITNKPR